MDQLGEFGLGVGLYYHMIAVVGLMLAAAGAINAHTIAYFKSGEYSDQQPGIEGSMQGSAICTERTGLLDYFTIMMLFGALSLLGLHQEAEAERMDVSEQTAQDYSIIVQDPDKDATDPAEWREFFSKFGHVSYVTVALNNGDFIQTLANRRSIVNSLMLETGGEGPLFERAMNVDKPMTRKEPLPCWKALLQKVGMASDVVFWHEKLREITLQVRAMGITKYEASKVYVIYEQEEGQRKCLAALTTGLIPALLESSTKISTSRKFRSTNVLKVEEPSEPGEINWVNQHYTLLYRAIEQSSALLFTAVLVGISALIIWATSLVDPVFSAAFISISNTVLPTIIKMITAKEHHLTDSAQQSSLLMKIIMVQWMNTAFIIYIIRPRPDLLTEEYVAQISKDAFTQPILLLLDLPGKLSHYVLAPMAKSQLKMNSYFLGSGWFLAERYSNMLKTVFVALYFSAIFPAGYFIAALAMFINYWVNKYCLLRIWRTPPPMSDFITKASWPHNGLQLGTGSVTSVTPDVASLGISAGSPLYTDFYVMESHHDPWKVRTGWWMTDDQKILVTLYSITAIVMTVIIAAAYFGKEAAFSIYHLFHGAYKPVGDTQGISYSDVAQIQAYVPQVSIPTIPHPLLATDLSKLNRDHISWSGDFDHYNLCSSSDLPDIKREDRVKLFSPCVHFVSDDHRCSIFAEAPEDPLTKAKSTNFKKEVAVSTNFKKEVAVSGTTTPINTP
ncbi:hypothetical protein JKP88DRAFT_288252 [Tribonema minus]|uniref:CSC1/OSCA1-like cytosolic domain-containing protein n=1 Tax=Tribonema minus TaxID=303371 RepID=A0A835ZBF6_9STRA|nr:hypothetical protein JKP88DRAFT_288252 [Tribonema minus]